MLLNVLKRKYSNNKLPIVNINIFPDICHIVFHGTLRPQLYRCCVVDSDRSVLKASSSGWKGRGVSGCGGWAWPSRGSCAPRRGRSDAWRTAPDRSTRVACVPAGGTLCCRRLCDSWWRHGYSRSAPVAPWRRSSPWACGGASPSSSSLSLSTPTHKHHLALRYFKAPPNH